MRPPLFTRKTKQLAKAKARRGAQAGQKRLTEAGFTSVRRAAETPTNMVLEVTG